VFALRTAGRKAAGATLYVTLEPCAHFSRTPPCVDAILAAGVRRVVIGMIDPNPRVRGRAVRQLRKAGVQVSVGVREAECRHLLAGYRTYILKGRPLVVLKLAASLDGRIATVTGASRWITGRAARQRAQELRNRLDAVMVGARTVQVDNSRLTCRLPGGRDPIRVVVDGRLSISPRARVVRVRSRAPTWIFTAADASRRRAAALSRAGAEVIRLRRRGSVDLDEILRELGRRGLTSVLVEGGATLAALALRARLVDRLVVFLAPKLIGGDGVPMIGPLGTKTLHRAVSVHNVEIGWAGTDLVVKGSLPFTPFAM
jgi:diaminohydroxyphosphoribosylaminopyrimidine deaminase/5-amino-6-(5-phosphoribosylamino)uracil reductase